MIEFPLIMEVRMKVRVFLGDSLNKNIPSKKTARLLKRASSLRCSRPWHDSPRLRMIAQAHDSPRPIAHARVVILANQKKGGLGGR